MHSQESITITLSSYADNILEKLFEIIVVEGTERL